MFLKILMYAASGAVLLFCAILFVSFYVFIARKRKYIEIEDRTDLSGLWRELAKKFRNDKAFIASLPTEAVTLKAFDGILLHGLFIPAKASSNKTVLCVHGYRSSSLNEFAVYVPFYYDLGCNVLLVDCRAHGKSGGKAITFGYYDKYDCLKWCEYLKNRFKDECRIMLHGISMGAATSIMTAGENPDALAGVVADCGYSEIWDVFKHVMKRDLHFIPYISLFGINLINLLFSGFSLRKCSTVAQLKKAHCPFLFIHGDCDRFVPPHMAQVLYDACTAQKNLLLVKGATHATSFWTDTDTVSSSIKAFMQSINF